MTNRNASVVPVAQRPLIWVLKGLRAGDNAQAMELALQLGGRVESKQLHFNISHMLPNGLGGARVSHLTSEARALLRPPWPDLVIGTGKRTAAVNLWIRHQSGGRCKSVQLGRPRMNLEAFDLVVTTPQYGLPVLSNVMQIPLPFARAKTVQAAELDVFKKLWSHLPRPWVVGVIGGHKFPQRLRSKELRGFGSALHTMCEAKGGSAILLDSPRSPQSALTEIAAQISGPKWVYQRGQGPNPYQPALALGDAFLVTSDSVSMVTEMHLTGKPTDIFFLPVSRLAPRWRAAGFSGRLAQSGLLHPPRDVDGLMRGLQQLDVASVTAAHAEVIARITSLL